LTNFIQFLDSSVGMLLYKSESKRTRVQFARR
jgi:hypothetical protein